MKIGLGKKVYALVEHVVSEAEKRELDGLEFGRALVALVSTTIIVAASDHAERLRGADAFRDSLIEEIKRVTVNEAARGGHSDTVH